MIQIEIVFFKRKKSKKINKFRNELDDSVELPHENVNIENKNEKEIKENKEVLVQANRQRNEDIRNNNINQNLKNLDENKMKEIKSDEIEKNPNENQNQKEVGKDKIKNKKANNDQACKCVIF